MDPERLGPELLESDHRHRRLATFQAPPLTFAGARGALRALRERVVDG